MATAISSVTLPPNHVKVHCWTGSVAAAADRTERVCLEIVRASRGMYIRLAIRDGKACLMTGKPLTMPTCTVVLCNLDVEGMLRDFIPVQQRLARQEMDHMTGLYIADNPMDSNCSRVNSASLAYTLLVQGGILNKARYEGANFSGPRTRDFQKLIPYTPRPWWRGSADPKNVELTTQAILKLVASAADTRDEDRGLTTALMCARLASHPEENRDRQGDTESVSSEKQDRENGAATNAERAADGEDEVTEEPKTWVGEAVAGSLSLVAVLVAGVAGVLMQKQKN